MWSESAFLPKRGFLNLLPGITHATSVLHRLDLLLFNDLQKRKPLPHHFFSVVSHWLKEKYFSF